MRSISSWASGKSLFARASSTSSQFWIAVWLRDTRSESVDMPIESMPLAFTWAPSSRSCSSAVSSRSRESSPSPLTMPATSSSTRRRSGSCEISLKRMTRPSEPPSSPGRFSLLMRI